METVRTLLELQERDLSILRLTKELDEMPEKRSILAARAKIADIVKIKERTAGVLRHMDQAAGVLEDTIAGIKTKMDSEQAKLMSGEITNAKELQAVSHELDALRRRVEQLEGELYAQMEKREAGAAQAAKIDNALDDGARVEAELTARFKARGGDLLSHLESERHARAALAAALPADVLARYEAARAAHHGMGVGALAGSMCGACRVTLPAGKVQTLVEGPELGTCPNCGRILIVRGA
jgi:hypothetical protein